MLLCCISASAHDFEVDGIYYNITDSEKLTVEVTYRGSSYNEYEDEYTGKVVIPESVIYNDKTYSVTSIGSEAFRFCSGLTSIAIPNSVTSIGYNAFKNCSGLTSIEIPNSVTSIGSDTFYNCYGLTSVTIPNSVTSIGSYAFGGCKGLTSIVIPNSVTSIGSYAFYSCDGLTSVHISDIAAWCNIKFSDYSANPLYYANHLYMNGKEIKDLVIPEGVTSIGSYAFYKCSDLTSIEIPNSVTSIGSYAFQSCSGLTSIAIPNSVTSIGDGAFSSCSGLTSVTIPDEVTTINEYTFNGCSKLKSVILPEKLNIIKKNAFYNCKSLESITIPNSVEFIYQNAFDGCSALQNVKVLAETPPFAYDNSFSNYGAELSVPEKSITAYQETSPWSKFATFKILTGEDVEVKTCATPTISYSNGEISFGCETEGVEFVSSISNSDIANYNTSKININVTYTISVYATKNGYKDSKVAKATLCWIDVEPKTEGVVETEISNVKALPVMVQVNGGMLTVSGANDGTKVEVFTIAGAEVGSAVTSANTAAVNVSQLIDNVIIVKVGSKAIKVMME